MKNTCLKQLLSFMMIITFIFVINVPYKSVRAYNNLYYGIDVSAARGTINWDKVENSGIDFAIIRAGYGNANAYPWQKDKYFDYNISNAKRVGIKCGVYWFCYATSVKAAYEEADSCYAIIKGIDLDYPVYVDVEDEENHVLFNAFGHDKNKITEMTLAFCNRLSSYGVKVGVYANSDWFSNYIDKSQIINSGYEIWLAHYPAANYAVDPTGYDKSSACGVWQYSDKATVNGVPGNVDVNVSYKNYDIEKPGWSKLTITNGKTDFTVGDTISFQAMSDSATGYTIGIDKDGTRAVTEEMSTRMFSYIPDSDGSYSAYVTAYNSAGYCDSERVIFTVSNPRIEIFLNPNGGSCSKDSITVGVGGTYNGLVEAGGKIGYTFNGWYSDISGGIQVNNGDNLISSTVHTLYAQWTPNRYAISFDVDGIAERIVTYDQLYGSFESPFRTGYTFVGWFTAPDGGSKIEPDTTVKITSDQKLYAHWNPNQYTVILNANGGTVYPETITVIYDSTYSGLPDAEKTGYHFNGWFTATDGGTQISPNDKVLITEKQTFYAHWSKDTMMITFDARGGISEGGTKLVRYDSKYGVLPNAERTGYTFNGWYLDENYANQITPDTIVQITANQLVYAKWTLNRYIIAFDANGGTVEIASKQVNYGKNYGVLPQAEKENDTFIGWFTEDGTEITSSEIVKLENDTILYAKWQSETTVVGDVNLDRTFDVKDVKFLLDYLHGREKFKFENFNVADLNHDGKVNVFDLVTLKRMLLERNGEA